MHRWAVSHSEMSAAVKLPSEHHLAALLLSVGLHGALLMLPLVAALRGHAPPRLETLPNSIAMVGNSIEVEAPTPEPAAIPAAAQPESVDVRSLPAESAPAPEPEREPATVPAPKPKSERRPKPARAPSAAAAAPAAKGSEAPTAGAPAAGTFGQEGLAPGVRRLGYAFTRAIPAATPADSAWRELPAGHVGTIRIELEVDENNHLGALKRWQARPGEPAPPAVLQRMVERTLLLLRAGQFALSGSNQPGSERLIIDVELRDGPADDEGTNDVVNKGFDGATPGHPGKAHFRYGTGRTFEAKVTIATSGH
jgi:hypothetical protein